MILVTGGTGYIGSLLVQELLFMGETVRVLDTQWFGNPFQPHPRLELIQADISDCDPAWLDGVDGVIHLAGLSNDPTADFAPQLSVESNVMGTRCFAEAVAERATAGKREIRFLFASTCSVYYSPTAPADLNIESMTEDLPVAPTTNYSKTKRLAEIDLLRVAEAHPLFCPVIVRKGTVFGRSPRMRFDLVVNTFTMCAWRKRLVTVHGHGEAWRPLLHIRDAADAYIYLLSSPAQTVRCETFNLVHKNYRILELAHWVAEILEQHRGVTVQVMRDRSGEHQARSYYVSGSKINKMLGYRPQRGTAESILDIWDALERGEFGTEPENDPRYFNIQWLKQSLTQRVCAGR